MNSTVSSNKSETRGVLVVDTVAPFLNALNHNHQVYLEKKERDMKIKDMEIYESTMQSIPHLEEMTLSKFIKSNLRLSAMIYDSFITLKNFTKSDGGLVYLACEGNDYLYICPTYTIPVFKGSGLRYGKRYGGTLVSWVAKNKKIVVTDDISSDPRFESSTGEADMCVKAAMGLPVLTVEGDLIAVIELIRRSRSGAYNIREKTAAKTLALWMGANIGINHEICYWSTKEQLITYLLHMIYYFTSSLPYRESNDNMISAFMNFIKSFLGVSQARLYMKVEEGFLVYLEVHDEISGNTFYEKTRRTISETVAEQVMTTGQPLNLTREEVSLYTPLIANVIELSIFCYPIKQTGGEVKGAIEVLNKVGEDHFTEEDEEVIKLIAKFGQLFLRQHECLELKFKFENLLTFHSETIDRQMTPCQESLEEFESYVVNHEKFLSFAFYPRIENDEYIARLSQELFSLVLGDGYYKNPPNTFFLSIGIIHRRVDKYSSFVHSFLVMHSLAYILLLHRNFFTQSEKEEMMLSAIMHTINTRKSNRQYMKTVSEITYRANICRILLRKYNCYTKEKFESITSLFKIYSLHHSFLFHKKLLKLLLTKKFRWMNPVHRFLIKALIIRVAENAIWYKPCSYAASRAYTLLEQINKNLTDVHPCRKPKIFKTFKKPISRKRFFEIIEKELTHQHLPNIYILSMFMDNLGNLADLCSENLRQWQILKTSSRCFLWHQEISWAYTTMDGTAEDKKNSAFTDYLNLLNDAVSKK